MPLLTAWENEPPMGSHDLPEPEKGLVWRGWTTRASLQESLRPD